MNKITQWIKRKIKRRDCCTQFLCFKEKAKTIRRDPETDEIRLCPVCDKHNQEAIDNNLNKLINE